MTGRGGRGHRRHGDLRERTGYYNRVTLGGQPFRVVKRDAGQLSNVGGALVPLTLPGESMNCENKLDSLKKRERNKRQS